MTQPEDRPRVTDKRRRVAAPADNGEAVHPDASLFDDRIEVLRAAGRERALTDDEQHELLRLQALEADATGARQQAGEPVLTAYLVVVREDGSAAGIADLNHPIAPSRPATLDDMYSSSALIQRDINVALGSRHVLGIMQGAMMEQQRAEMARLDLHGGRPSRR